MRIVCPAGWKFIHPFGCAKPRLLRRGKEARLRVNLEQAPAFRLGSREVHNRRIKS